MHAMQAANSGCGASIGALQQPGLLGLSTPVHGFT
jgi:hypothetical protein